MFFLVIYYRFSKSFVYESLLHLTPGRLEKLDFLSESSKWFVLEDDQLSPGVYKIKNSKILNSTYEQEVYTNDKVKVNLDCYPIDTVFGLNIYEVTHLKTNQNIYITTNELIR